MMIFGSRPRLTVGSANAATNAGNGGGGLGGGLTKLDGDCTALTSYHQQHRRPSLGQGGGGGTTLRKGGHGGDTTLINRAFQGGDSIDI